MEIKKRHFIGVLLAVVIIALDIILLRDMKIFYFIMGICMVISALPFVVTLILESNREKENGEMFLEFARNLVESVKAGTPVSKSIINLRDKYYGSLSPHIQKLANQISLGIPVKKSLETFAQDVDSRIIERAINLISEAEKAGGEVEGILESVASSVNEIEKLKKERQSAIYSLVVQGYIIFLVFIAIMLIMQFKIIPMTSEISSAGTEFGGFASANYSVEQISAPMLYLLLFQGFFTGFIIGKLAEGNLKAGIKHSFALVVLSLLIYTGAKAFM